MAHDDAAESAIAPWTAVADPAGSFSSGIAELDRLLGGGFPAGTLALLDTDVSVGPDELMVLLAPVCLNFLGHSNGIIAVLPGRMSPAMFRSHLTRSASRKLFDTRVRVIDYVGESEPRPYVVRIHAAAGSRLSSKEVKKRGADDMAKMSAAETAVRGVRGRMFLELNAFEVMDTLVGSEMAARMFFHGIKRVQSVGNLCLGILRPGLGCADTVRSLAATELTVRKDARGVVVRGVRPAFPERVLIADPAHGPPSVALAASM
jgi:hypothetical protein